MQQAALGDDAFYEELARPLDERRIVPMIQQRDLEREARALFEQWAAKPDKQDF